MTQTSELRAADPVQMALARKLEFAIISVLSHYSGQYKEEMVEWFSALRLALPQLTDTRQLRNAFIKLSEEGIVDLAGFPPPPEGDDKSSNETAFTTTLTAAGKAHWNALHLEVVGAVAI